MHRVFQYSSIAAAVWLTAGCAKSDPIVGTWSGSLDEGSPSANKHELDLEPGGKARLESKQAGVTFEGSWERTDAGVLVRAETRNGKSVAGKDGMTVAYTLSKDGTSLSTADNPIVFHKSR